MMTSSTRMVIDTFKKLRYSMLTFNQQNDNEYYLLRKVAISEGEGVTLACIARSTFIMLHSYHDFSTRMLVGWFNPFYQSSKNLILYPSPLIPTWYRGEPQPKLVWMRIGEEGDEEVEIIFIIICFDRSSLHHHVQLELATNIFTANRVCGA